MYTIGQFSRICQVSAKALRHYEKIGLLLPARVDQENQYRYYSPEQIDAVKAITFMKDLGIPLKTVKQIIEQGNQPGEIELVLEEQRTALLEQLSTLNGRLVRLGWWKKSMEDRSMNDFTKYDIRLRDIPETLVFSERRILTSIHDELPVMLRALLDTLAATGAVCSGAPIMLYYDDFSKESFNPNKVDVEVAWPVADPQYANRTLPAVRVAALTYVGPYDGLESAYGAVIGWINENGYHIELPTREASLNDPSVTPPEQLVTEILIPVK
ncbi:MAG: MerR family transcriptional regulator [Deltaproteobacteria bacterium]